MIQPTRDQTGAWALVPVKALGRARTRLSPLLSAEQRSALQRAMLSDVLAALSRARRPAGVAIVSPDADVSAIASRHGASFIAEQPATDDLSMAVAAGTERLRRAGAAIVAVIPADVPMLDPLDIDCTILRAEEAGATIVVPDRDLQGTNALVFGAEIAPGFVYGPHSFRAHMAARAGSPAVALPPASLANDIDRPADLLGLAGRCAAAGAHETSAIMTARQNRWRTTSLEEARQ